MTSIPPVTFTADADGVGWIVFDDRNARANVFTSAMQNAFTAALDVVEDDRTVKAVVLKSGKERIFIAGADLNLLAQFPDAAAATEFSRRGQRLFQRVADFPVPIVCAIHGACAGGGFELALACSWRIASEDTVTQIGLPETSIGTIPGWGGSVRLPRSIGVKPALDHILKAQLAGARASLETGLVNEIVPPSDLSARAGFIALQLAAKGRPLNPPSPAVMPDYFAQVRNSVQARTRGYQPAMIAAIDVVAQTVDKPLAEALEIEARIFGEVTAGPVCRNLVRVFFLRDAAKKRTLEGWFGSDAHSQRSRGAPASTQESGQRTPPPIRRIGVVGAGVMGSGIAHWLAMHGFEVVLRDVAPELVARGLEVIRGLFDEAVRRGKLSAGAATSRLQQIATTTGWDGFEACDVVIEAIVEDVRAKQRLFVDLASVVGPDTILASNTSALPIEEMAGSVDRPGRTLGIHFFNPVSRMPLVELIFGPHTSFDHAERALGLVKALKKTPVICRSSPGFLVTRVLFFYLNEAVRLHETGAATVEIDGAMLDFGWPMGPMRLIDEVGVDVTDFIFRELEHYFPGRFTRATSCERMLARNLLGRKNGTSRGFYRYEGGIETVNDEVLSAPGVHASVGGDSHEALREPGDISGHLMRIMVREAQRCLDEGVVRTADDIDFALLSGAGFPAFRGGLMHWARGAGVLD